MLLPADQVEGNFLDALVYPDAVCALPSAASFDFEAAAWRRVEQALWINASARSSRTRTCITAAIVFDTMSGCPRGAIEDATLLPPLHLPLHGRARTREKTPSLCLVSRLDRDMTT